LNGLQVTTETPLVLFWEDLAEHAEEMNEHLIHNIGLTPFECDELWSTIKKQKKVEREGSARSEEGDAWVYTCIKRNTYFFAAFAVEKWTENTCRKMMETETMPIFCQSTMRGHASITVSL